MAQKNLEKLKNFFVDIYHNIIAVLIIFEYKMDFFFYPIPCTLKFDFIFFSIIHTINCCNYSEVFFLFFFTNLTACVETVTRLKGSMRDGGKQLKRLDGGQTKWLSGESRWLVKDSGVGRNSPCTRKQPNSLAWSNCCEERSALLNVFSVFLRRGPFAFVKPFAQD